MKICTSCKSAKPLAEFHRDKSKNDGHYTICSACTRAKDKARYPERREGALLRLREYYKLNGDVIRKRSAQWHRDNSERKAMLVRAYHASHQEDVRRNRKKWERANPAYTAEMASRRRHGKRIAIPTWANADAMRAIYAEARRKTRATGVMHHVDHIVPLKSTIVCGLHVEHNLQILPWRENIKKHNRYWPDMPEAT